MKQLLVVFHYTFASFDNAIFSNVYSLVGY